MLEPPQGQLLRFSPMQSRGIPTTGMMQQPLSGFDTVGPLFRTVILWKMLLLVLRFLVVVVVAVASLGRRRSIQ